MYPDPKDLVRLGESYAKAHGLALATVSTRVFNDGKVLGRLKAGCDITMGRYHTALDWFRARRTAGGWS